MGDGGSREQIIHTHSHTQMYMYKSIQSAIEYSDTVR